ncbi:hypothetical protein B0H19DRAFT_1147431 [Mycena capillaripes]|nr:hypothetical protein B0H19DRAFT_1147431 [Mycena capillaripes]
MRLGRTTCLPQVDTIQHLMLDMYPHDIHQLRLNPWSFPLLRSVGFGNDDDVENLFAQETSSVKVFRKAPLLHELYLTYRISYYILPWSQLTKFDGNLDTMVLFSSALNLIETSCFVESCISNPPGSLGSTITHTRPRSLTLRTSPLDDQSEDILRVPVSTSTATFEHSTSNKPELRITSFFPVALITALARIYNLPGQPVFR